MLNANEKKCRQRILELLEDTGSKGLQAGSFYYHLPHKGAIIDRVLEEMVEVGDIIVDPYLDMGFVVLPQNFVPECPPTDGELEIVGSSEPASVF